MNKKGLLVEPDFFNIKKSDCWQTPEIFSGV